MRCWHRIFPNIHKFIDLCISSLIAFQLGNDHFSIQKKSASVLTVRKVVGARWPRIFSIVIIWLAQFLSKLCSLAWCCNLKQDCSKLIILPAVRIAFLNPWTRTVTNHIEELPVNCKASNKLKLCHLHLPTAIRGLGNFPCTTQLESVFGFRTHRFYRLGIYPDDRRFYPNPLEPVPDVFFLSCAPHGTHHCFNYRYRTINVK